MDKMNLPEEANIFDGCDWGSRASVKEALEKYIEENMKLLAFSGENADEKAKKKAKEKAAKMPKDLSEAILEDIEVRRYSVDLWKQVEDIEEDSLFEGHGEDITKRFVEGLMEAEDNDNEKGLAKYTARYGRTTREKLKNGIESCGTYVEKRLGRDLYEKIYPVFWLAMLNCPHKSKIDKEKHILDPIKKGTEREQYLFALLIDKRVEDIGNHSIFSGIKRVYLSRLKRTKKAVENFDMRCAEERYCFVRWVKKYLLKENKSGNMKNRFLRIIF